jgi:threonine dehydrogenase-like Zn-dependent dehydrogenase
MKTLALRLYGARDLRLEKFDLPPIRDDEVLADVVTNSICMSSHKAAEQGANHKRVPGDVAENPVIIGHEFSGTILEVGDKYRDTFQVGMKYSIQPAIVYPGREFDAPGYSFQYFGGQATCVIVPKEVLEPDCLLPFDGEGLFKASLSEPLSCIIGAFHSQYHHRTGEYVHTMGIVEGGAMAILAGAGPMGLGAIDYTIHGPRKPRLLVVTDIDQARLDRAARILTPQEAKRCGVQLHYVNTGTGNALDDLRALGDGEGYDDVFVFAPVAARIEQASALLGINGCLNFFAGPSSKDFSASINFYDVHYGGHHVLGASGGNTDDMREALDLMAKNVINPAMLITHVGGIDCAAETILNLPNIPGGKKLIYTKKSMPLAAIDDFEEIGKTDPFYRDLAAITAEHNGLWSVDAEKYVLQHAENIAL